MVIGNAVLRGLAKTRTAFFIGTFSNLLSLLLAYMMIFWRGNSGPGSNEAPPGAWELPNYAAVSWRWWFCRSIPISGCNGNRFFSWHPATISRILEISVPAAVEQAALQGGRVFFTFMLAGVGAAQFAAHQIAVQIESVSFLPGFGFSVAVMAFVAQSLGKGSSPTGCRLYKSNGRFGFCRDVNHGSRLLLVCRVADKIVY